MNEFVDQLADNTSKTRFKRRQPLQIGFDFQKNRIVTYKITPHADISNNNKRLWHTIYKLYELYERPGTRLERNGLRFTLREKDNFWFDVVFKQKDDRKSVTFYVSTSEYQAEKLKRKLENKMSATFTEVSAEELAMPFENTVVQEMRYLKHDVFSLNTNSQDVKTPVGSILNTVNDLTFDGDIARLSICAEAENRNKWVKSAQWALEKARNGKVPQRATINGRRIGAGLKIFIAGVINQIYDLLTDIFEGLSNAFTKSDKKLSKDPFIKKAYSIENEIGTTNIPHDKANLPVFKVHMRIAAHSEDRLTRETLAEDMALAHMDLSQTNELNGVKVNRKGERKRIITELNTLELSKKTKLDPNVNLMSTDELSKLALMMPNRELQRIYADAMQVKTRTEVTIPGVMRNANGIYLGMAELKDEKIEIYMPITNPDNFYRGYTFIGGQGAGKDTAIKNWVVEGNRKHGISFVVIDAIVEEGERGMADGIRDAIPPENIIDLNMNDDDFIPPMDLTEVVTALGRNGASRFADEMIDFMQISGLNRSEKYLTDAAKASGGSLYNIKRIIEDADFRIDTIERLMNSGNIRLANELASWSEDNDKVASKCEAILYRLNRFFGNERLYDIFAQAPLPDLDFRKWMREGKVIIIRVPNGRGLGEHAVKTLVHWITLKTFMTRMLMTKEEQENGCFIVFNEPEQYESDGLSKLMGRIGTEGRKERLGALYAFHHWNKLSPSLQENLQGGGVQQFLFANDHTKTFDLSKHRFEDTIPLDEAHKLPDHHAIISVRANNELQPAFICHMAPPVASEYDNSFLTKRHARMYGRSWKELQKAL